MIEAGVQPDQITFINLLNACSHSGLVDEALKIFNSIPQYSDGQITAHETCIVDALSRAGRLDEAEEFIAKMKCPDITTWTTVLGACRWRGDVSRAKRIAEKVLALHPNDGGVFSLLSNTFAEAGLFEESANIRRQMETLGIKKIPGKSWITIAGQRYTFVVDDKDNPCNEEIRNKLQRLHEKMKQAGYTPDITFVRDDIPQTQKETHLCFHSERMAIGFGLLKTSPGTPLVVFSNLRVCRDCHNATKYLSIVDNRKISVRDANRWHIFENGKCSCNDCF